ncbi:alpha/beta hydrolase [Micromonospora sp. NPDC000089]|uniref:alpha/beta hydrolase n=1 Tax=unclassified Micromonospora TaxID=2617518 RepID=UPI0036C92095
MNGYARLWAASPADWADAGVAWRALTGPVEGRRAELGRRATELRPGWSGAAAGAADRRLGTLRGQLAGLSPALLECDQVLAEFAGRLAVAKARLAEAVALADRSGVLVDRHGVATAAPGPVGWTGPEAGVTPDGRPGAARHAPTRQASTARQAAARTAATTADRAAVERAAAAGRAAAAERVAAAVGDALALADTADREATARLAELAAAARSGWTAPPPPGRPGPDAEPAEVRAWWSGLAPAQRRWLVAHEPALVGRLDGVPAAARDQANRLTLGAHREALLTIRRMLADRFPRGPVELAGLRRIDASLAALAALTGRLAESGSPRAYLLRLATAGEGRAVVALGNPDRADRVLTYVPGMTSDLADVPGELGRAGLVRDRCGRLAPGAETAAVLWLDYDAPDFLHEAAWSAQARDAGPGLHRFQEGLRATHEGAPARQTVLGHSYGSVVVGSAARDHGLAADALVFVGSPGVGVAHAEALRLPPDRVFASTAPDDVIRLVESPGRLAGRAALATSPLGAAVSLLGRSDHELWFGHDPSDPAFGGRTFPSGRHGHTGYWDDDNPALDGMARIVLGQPL